MGRAIDEAVLPVGVVVERRQTSHPWQEHAWRPVAVIAGAAKLDPKGDWVTLGEGPSWTRFHAGTLSLSFFRRETEGYKVNLSQQQPRVFVVMRTGYDMGCAHETLPFHVTVCPYEAQDYLDSGDELVEAVPMPQGLIALVQDYVDRHHKDEPFYKRKRKKHKVDDDRRHQGTGWHRGGRTNGRDTGH